LRTAAGSSAARGLVVVVPRAAFRAGVDGALCDDTTRADLRALADRYRWTGA
jgi:hypothetical protein